MADTIGTSADIPSPWSGPDQSSGRREHDDVLAALMGRVANGDENAFETLYAATAHRVFGLARRIVRNTDIAADIVQEVYIQAWSSAHTYQSRLGTVRNWLFTLAHRRCVDRIRSENSSLARSTTYAQQWAAVARDSTDDLVSDSMMHDAVRECIRELPDAQTAAIKLTYYGGLTYAQAAHALSIPVPTAKSRIRAGLRRMKDCLESKGYGDSDGGASIGP